MTESAPVTVSSPPSLLTAPPSAWARASARNRTWPAMPLRVSPEPSMATVIRPGEVPVTSWGLSKAAVKETEPGVSAVSRTAMTWSGWLAITSRR